MKRSSRCPPAWAAPALLAALWLAACSGQEKTAQQGARAPDTQVSKFRPSLTPVPGSERPAGQVATVVSSFWEGFQGEQPGARPVTPGISSCGDCSVKVVDQPTVLYHRKAHCQRRISDLCLELDDPDPAAGQVASVTVNFPTVASGELELELLARSFEGQAAELALVGPAGKVRAAVVVDAEGRFVAVTSGGRSRMRDGISYANRPPGGVLRLQPGRWFTLRFTFAAGAGRYGVELVNLYKGLGSKGVSHHVLAADLPMLNRGPVAGLRISTGQQARLLVDNIIMASPSAPLLNGQPRQTPLRTILGFVYPLRVDPVSVNVFGIRNLTSVRVEHGVGGCSEASQEIFWQAAEQYNRLLVRQALLVERAQNIKRVLGHLGDRASRVSEQRRAALTRIRDTRRDLDHLLGAYGEAFLDTLNTGRLEQSFSPAVSGLDHKLAQLEREAEQLAQQVIAAAGGELERTPPLAPGPYDGPLQWRNGRFERGGQPAVFYFAVGATSRDMTRRGQQQRLLGLDNTFLIPFVLDPPNRPGRVNGKSFSWRLLDRYIKSYLLRDNPSVTFGVRSKLASTRLKMLAPAWWLEQQMDDEDIFFMDREGGLPPFNKRSRGKPYLARKVRKGRYVGGGGYLVRLNFWNPKVQAMFRQLMEQWSQHMNQRYPGKLTFFAVANEGAASGPKENGFNPSAVAAFRRRLARRYRTVGRLNRQWGTAYSSFEAIDPRSYSRQRPGGLIYEFQRFRLEGYWAWLGLIKAGLKRHLPDTVLLDDFHNAGYREIPHGLDLPRMFETYDLVGNHYVAKEAGRDLGIHRRLDALRKVYGRALGNFEWSVANRADDLFDEQSYKAAALMDMFEQLAWGRSALAIWYGHSAGYSEGAQLWVPALRDRLLRFSTSFIPVGRLRARRFAGIALTHPTVTPLVNILDSSSSFLNGVRSRTTRRLVARALSSAHWNYGFLEEDLLAEGRQTLGGTKTLVVPRAVCLRPEVSRKLLEWTRGGGTLVAILPPGALDPYGQPDGSLLRAAMGGLTYDLAPPYKRMTVSGTGGGAVTSRDLGTEGCKLLAAALGKGRVALLTCADPLPEKDLLKLVERHTPRQLKTSAGRFRMVLRRSRKRLYLFVFNTDLRHARTDQVSVAGEHRDVVDLGFEVAFPVPSRVERGFTRLQLRLAPGEGTVLRLTPR
jgi:hypothetical protein